MKKPVVATRLIARRVFKVAACVVIVVATFLVGEAHGESHAAAVAQAAAIDETNAADNAYCAEVFGTTFTIAATFHSPVIVLDTASTSIATGDDICAYRVPSSKNDELVLFVLSSKPSNLVGKLGVLTQLSVEVKHSGSAVFVVTVSTDKKVPVTSSVDGWLTAAGNKALG